MLICAARVLIWASNYHIELGILRACLFSYYAGDMGNHGLKSRFQHI